MKNQTILQKDILELGQNYHSVSGYCLIIYKNGAFKTLISEGQSYKPAFFENKSALEVIAVVSPSLTRTVSFKSSYFHSDSIHQYVIEYYLTYQVTDVRTVADKRLQDPLRQIQNKVKQDIGHQIGKIDWDVLYKSDAADFENIKRELLAYETVDMNNEAKSTTTILQSFAQAFGINLLNIDFKFIIPEDYIIHKKKKEQSYIKTEVKNIEHHEKVQDLYNQGELERIKAQNDSTKMYYSLYDAVETAVKNVGSSIDNPNKFLEAVKAGIEAQNLVQTRLSPIGSAANAALQSGTSPTMQLGSGQVTSSSNVQGAGQYATLINTIRGADIGFESKKSFFATYLQLVAAVLEDNDEKEDELIDELIDMGLPATLNELIKSRKTFSKEIEMVLR